MASYQEMEVRLKGLEERVKFLMTTMRGKVMEPTGMLAPDGRPMVRQRDVTLEDVFLMAKAQNAVVENVAANPPQLEDKNG